MTRFYGIARVTLLALAGVCCTYAQPAAAQFVNASGDENLPPTTTLHQFQGGAFEITRDVALDTGSGPWIKELQIGPQQGLASGQNALIIETLHNIGNVPWTDWHERIVTRTAINVPDDAPGFLFNSNSLHLSADYGGGFVNLLLGTDFILFPTLYSGPGFSENNNDWEAIDIFFAPHAAILPGDTLRIEKQIFEVFLDANIWRPEEIAEVLQYPTPEPVSAALFACGALSLLARRRASL